MKELSEWQKLRVRDALRAYYKYGRVHDGRSFNWKDVREAIAEYTGQEIGSSTEYGGERLRQFVEGQKDKRKGPGLHYPVPDPIEAVTEFVTHEDLELLTSEELEEYAPPWQAPLRLLEYLNDGTQNPGEVPTEKLEGSYRAINTRGEKMHTICEITLSRALENGLIQVMEMEEFYPPDSNLSLRDMALDERRTHRTGFIKHGGWAVLTPEDNLLFYLKNTDDRRNRYYCTVASKTTLWEMHAPYDVLALVRQDFPLELMATQELSAEIVIEESRQDIDERLQVFEKI